MRSPRSRMFVLVGAFAAVWAGASARGQDATTPQKPAEPALKGPVVPAQEAPARKGKEAGGKAGFGPDAIERKKTSGPKPAAPPTMVEFLRTLDVLRGGATPEAARLTVEQETKIKEIAASFDASLKAYMDSNRQELDTLRGKLSANDRNMLDQQVERGGPIRVSKAGFGGKKNVLKHKGDAKDAGAGAAPTGEDAAKTRARIVEIYANRPKAEDAQARIMGVLRSEQAKLVEEDLARREPSGHKHGKGRGGKGK